MFCAFLFRHLVAIFDNILHSSPLHCFVCIFLHKFDKTQLIRFLHCLPIVLAPNNQGFWRMGVRSGNIGNNRLEQNRQSIRNVDQIASLFEFTFTYNKSICHNSYHYITKLALSLFCLNFFDKLTKLFGYKK